MTDPDFMGAILPIPASIIYQGTVFNHFVSIDAALVVEVQVTKDHP